MLHVQRLLNIYRRASLEEREMSLDMSLSPAHRPPLAFVELALSAGSPWALWGDVDLVEGGAVAYLCVGGEVLSGEGVATLEVRAFVQALLPVTEGGEWADRLPSLLSASRFDPLRTQAPAARAEPWGAWGSRGWQWSPSLSLAYRLPELGASGEALRQWLEEATCLGAYAWDERGVALWEQVAPQDSSARARDPFDPRGRSTAREAFTRAISPHEDPSWVSRERKVAWCERVHGVTSTITSTNKTKSKTTTKGATKSPIKSDRLAGRGLEKVVLAREVRWAPPSGFEWDPLATWCACQAEALEGSCAYALSVRRAEVLVGLSPERLIRARGGRFETHALAGTRVAHSPEALPALEKELMGSEKDLHEHQLVVDELLRRLRPLTVSREALPLQVRRLRSLLHLETPIQGTLRPGVDPLELVDALHPSPALGGAPREQALAYLRETEPLERGGYAAPWCWLNRAGDLSAQVVIRSALISAHEARLYAGAGVVERSSPESEWQETEDKLEAIARRLRARPQPSQPSLNFSAAWSLLRGLIHEGGLVGAVISPGSRSTPLALLADALLETRVIIDERLAGFYALGWARSAGAPVALICTSGSAGAHYLPALVEARQAGIPLVALTADRPSALLGLGAPQTIDQRALFGAFVKGAWPLLTPSSPERSAAWLSAAREAGLTAVTHPKGPVHLNVPFDEPLWAPELELALADLRAERLQQASPESRGRVRRPVALGDEQVPRALLCAERGLIYCGPLSARQASHLAPLITELSERLGWPVWAEASSQLRGVKALQPSLIEWGERAARQGALPNPSSLDGLLLIGGAPHSRAVSMWLSAWGEHVRGAEGAHEERGERWGEDSCFSWGRPISEARCVLVGERPEPSNPLRLPCAWAQSEPHALLTSWLAWLKAAQGERSPLAEGQRVARDAWRARWRARDRADDPHSGVAPLQLEGQLWGGSIGALLSRALERRARPSEVAGFLPAELHVASSTAFRDLDMTLSRCAQVVVHSQRGANGIDGTLAAALGSLQAVESSAPLIVWIGDTAAHHDLASLIAWGSDPAHLRREAPSVILLVNNGGGGIFGLLPVRDAARFDELFLTSIQERQLISWESLASQAGFTYERHERGEGLAEALARALGVESTATHTPHLIELIVEPSYDLAQRRAYWSAATQLLTSDGAIQ